MTGVRTHSVRGAKFFKSTDLRMLECLGEGFFGQVRLCGYAHDCAGMTRIPTSRPVLTPLRDLSDPQVFKAISRATRETFAVKVFRDAIAAEDRESFIRELGLHRVLFHPNIIEFKGKGAAPTVRVKAKFTVKHAVCESLSLQHTANLTVNLL